MRIANQSIYDGITARLITTSDALQKANEIVSSGKRINHLSDDPVGLVQVLGLRSALSNMSQIQRNIGTGRTWLNGGETALESVKELISDAKVLGLQMANGTVSAAEREGAAEQVNGILEQIVSLANTQVNGQYVFSGTKTDVKPFEISYTAEDPTGVDYLGNGNPFTIEIGKDMDVPVGHDGEAVFGDVFQNLIDLRDALKNNDVDGISRSIPKLDVDFGRVINTVSEIGAREVRLDVKEKIIADLNLSYEERKSELEDADMLEAISELRATETAYEAALSSSAQVMRMSLLDYL
jgi:flagellar hook-associated protein 3 FlgL